jgi:1-deoxy-D-xylulose-5-phosphate synthase
MEEVVRDKTSVPRAADDAEKSSTGTLLDRIDSPRDLADLTRPQLQKLCHEIREFVIDVVSQKGGHLGASLGVVELTVALHHVLELPRDRIVWDTGHQAYVHKVLTGRRDALWTIRQYGGISGFLKRGESDFDAFGAGHASTSISAALGMAAARDMAGDDHRVVAVIGDGAMTGGLAYEALNNAGQSGRRLLVVVNDNGMSIAPNVGAIAHYLTRVTTSRHLKKLRDESLHLLGRLPALGEPMEGIARRLESAVKDALVPGALFQALGFNYFGPVDAHDLDLLLDLLPKVLERDGPVLLHVMTTKGKGLAPAEEHQESFHGVAPFDKVTGKARKASAGGTPSYTKVFGDAMLEAAETFDNVVAITAAMPSGTGLTEFADQYPTRFFDVGIAEAHGVCFAAGLACDGMRPVAAIYSTFLQRAFDQVVHDVALQRLPVVFALDRAGLVGADGPTHHGTLDLAYLRCVPGMVVSAPRDGNELRDLLWTGLHHDTGTFALRYPRGNVPEGFDAARKPRVLPIGSWEMLAEGGDVALLAVGAMVGVAQDAAERLAENGIAATVVNCRFVKPMDSEVLRAVRETCPVLVTVEENVLSGGFGAGVLDELERIDLSREKILRLGLPDRFVTHGSRERLLDDVGLAPSKIVDAVKGVLDRERS